MAQVVRKLSFSKMRVTLDIKSLSYPAKKKALVMNKTLFITKFLVMNN